MMVPKTSTRPSPRSSHSHSNSQSQSHRTSSRTSTTPLSPPARVPPSVGQALPPNANTYLRSPARQTDARTPSPNYFGLIVDPASDPRESAAGPKDNWSPPTSSILSFGATSPKHIPVDSNPDFEAFKKQSESGHSFNLNHGNLSHFASTPGIAPPRPRPDRRPTRSDTQERPPSPRTAVKARDGLADKMDMDRQYSERGSEASSSNAQSFFDIPRQESPAQMSMSPVRRNVLSHLDGRHPRLSLPSTKADPPSPHLKAEKTFQHQRADTLPSALEEGPVLMAPDHLRSLFNSLSPAQFLLLDLRVVHQFSQSRIAGALNLCIPTTLLKRPSFNLQKLQDTFSSDTEKDRFATWKTAKYIVVYDAFSSEKKDAISAVNTLKKFENEGWEGQSYILRGGFQEFSRAYPKMVDHRSSQEMQSSSKISLSLGTSMPEVAPVAGGCAMPATKNAANPFFSNIRQNQDLIGGVGQLDVNRPEDLGPEATNFLPRWLSEASAEEDHGKKVSDKFLRLEQDEQSRMTIALSSGVSYGTPGPDRKDVQIAGIEKGSKNRYNNIWPFEHARVKLQGRPDGVCDYVNASHIKSLRSNKRYIASQGPLPATFDDFWSVIWDNDVRVIVMLTAEKEGGQLKCHSYWSNKDYGSLKLKSLSEKKVSLDLSKHRTPAERRESDRRDTERRDAGRRRANTSTTSPPSPPATEPSHAIVRKFTLAHTARPFSPLREITQIHYPFWPDFGAPASPSQLLALVELCNNMQRASSSTTARTSEPENDEHARPALVHCSAGCGRTGTFCTIDTVIDMLKRQHKEIKSGVTPMDFDESATSSQSGDYMGKGKTGDEWVFDQDVDLVLKTVEDFRGQRLSMVQSLRQYVLCYETVLEWMAQQTFGGIRPSGGRERSGSDGGLERA